MNASDIAPMIVRALGQHEHLARFIALISPAAPHANALLSDPAFGPLCDIGASLAPNKVEIAELARILIGAITQVGEPWGISRYQVFLRDKGFYAGRIDGGHGEETDKAVKAYQKSRGLYVDGYVGIATMTQMMAEGA